MLILWCRLSEVIISVVMWTSISSSSPHISNPWPIVVRNQGLETACMPSLAVPWPTNVGLQLIRHQSSGASAKNLVICRIRDVKTVCPHCQRKKELHVLQWFMADKFASGYDSERKWRVCLHRTGLMSKCKLNLHKFNSHIQFAVHLN